MVAFTEITPDAFLERLRVSDPFLCDIISGLNLKKSHRLFEVKYPYGAYIGKAGVFQVPGDQQSESQDFNSSTVSPDVYDELSYRSIPLGVVMQKGYEVFRDAEPNIFPRSVRRTGLEMGIWEMFSPVPGYSATAGSRSVFFLPKIGDTLNHKRLKKYGVKRHPPHGYFDQWQVFTELASHPDFSEPWNCNIAYLGKQWVDDIFNNEKWLKLKAYLLEKALYHSIANRAQSTLDAIWENFRKNLAAKHYKTNPYVLETLKHLVMIANGALPGFKVANESTDLFPYRGIVKAYLNEYELKDYSPTMLYADYFDIEKDQSVYYSLQIPTCQTATKRESNTSTVRNDLFDLIELIDMFLADVAAARLGAFGQVYYDLFSRLEFEFFHSDPDEDKGVYSSMKMPESDPNLLSFGRKDFPYHASFVRGCIRIGKK